MSNKAIYYSEKYQDDEFEYRHVFLPKEMLRHFPSNRLLTESEWRALGVQQSPGWIHYMIHRPEPHILLFKRPLNYPNHATQPKDPKEVVNEYEKLNGNKENIHQ